MSSLTIRSRLQLIKLNISHGSHAADGLRPRTLDVLCSPGPQMFVLAWSEVGWLYHLMAPSRCRGNEGPWTRLQRGHSLTPLSPPHPWPGSTHQLRSGMCSFRCLPGPSSGSCVPGSRPHSGAGSPAGCGGQCGGACGHNSTSH